MKVRVSVPGKLFLAGEYAVVEAGNPAIIAAVDRYLSIRIETSATGSLHSSQNEGIYLSWCRRDQEFWIQGENHYPLVTTAIQVTEAYLRLKGMDCQDYYSLDIQSDLDDRTSGTKYGLGSSGAVTVATVKALLMYYGYSPSPLLVYKLAVIAQMKLEMTGSFGDLAASSFGGLIVYSSPDRLWLVKEMAEHSLYQVMEMEWKDLSIASLMLPTTLELLVGWTGSAASTERQVSQMKNQISQEEKDRLYRQFLTRSRACVEAFAEACKNDDQEALRQSVSENRTILRSLYEVMGLVIETPRLSQLCELAEMYGAVAKSSGAGGGDCGICLVDSQEQKQMIEEAWRQASILPLSLNISSKE